jgi:hypothetical protein
MKKPLLYGLAALAAGCTTAPAMTGPDPRDAAAAAPAPAYRSALEGYAGFRDEEAADWRRLNEEVGRQGGHRGAMRP